MRINKQIQARLGHPKASVELATTSLLGFQNDANPKVVVAMPYGFSNFTHALLHNYVKYFQVLTCQELHNYVKYFGIDIDYQYQQVYNYVKYLTCQDFHNYVKYFQVLTCQEFHNYVKYFESLDVSRVDVSIDVSRAQGPYWTWVTKQSGQLN